MILGFRVGGFELQGAAFLVLLLLIVTGFVPSWGSAP